MHALRLSQARGTGPHRDPQLSGSLPHRRASHGQVVNKSDLAAPLGMSVPGIGRWLDFLVPGKNGSVRLVEAKASRTPTPDMAASMRRLADAIGKRRGTGRPVEMFLVHRPARGGVKSRALAPGVQALAWEEFVAAVLP